MVRPALVIVLLTIGAVIAVAFAVLIAWHRDGGWHPTDLDEDDIDWLREYRDERWP